MTETIKRAADAVGSQKELARLLEVSPSFVSQWAIGVRRVPPTLCRKIEQITDGAVTCSELRPDIFGEQPGRGAA